MDLIVKPVQTRRDLIRFIHLPEKLHRRHPGWVPPFYSDERRIFSPRRNLSHQYCDSIYALAWLDSQPVGRIAGIVNHRYNKRQHTHTARFGYLESIDEPRVTSALLTFVESWARDKGMDRIVGPMGFTEEDPEGMLIEGFDEVPNMATYQNQAYLPYHLQTLEYAKEVDYVVYKVHLATAITDSYQKLYERMRSGADYSLKHFHSRLQIRAYVLPVFRLMNECFTRIYGYSQLTDPEMRQLARRYWALLDPRFIKVAVDTHDRVIGFILAIPSLAPGLIKARGRLLPWGWAHILKALKTSTKLDTYIGAVKEEYRGRGVDITLGYSIIQEAKKAGFEYLDGHHQLELNYRIRAEMERVGGVVSKRYRIFHKELG